MKVQLEKCSAEGYEKFLQDEHKDEHKAERIGSSFLQSRIWGEFKERQGWSAYYFRGTVEDETQSCDFALLVLTRPLVLRLFSFAYIPFGPVFLGQAAANGGKSEAENWLLWNCGLSARQYFAFCGGIVRKLLGLIPLSCFFVRLDSNALESFKVLGHQTDTEEAPQPVKSEAARFGFRTAVQRVQVPDTVILDLQLEEEELLAQMHKKHRYNIRLADKKGVQVRQVDWQQELAAWYELYQTTAQRDRIGIHKLSYYQSLFELQDKNHAVHLYCAYTQEHGLLLAGIIVLHYKYAATATYLYGASSNEHRELMPNYLLQWHAICEARKAGLLCYDFFGIPPQADPKHPMYGLYRFKVGFGTYAVRRSGAWDLPYSFVFYGLYRLLEYGRLLMYYLRHR